MIPSPRILTRWLLLLMAAICLLAYVAGLSGGFVFDSEVSLPRNERVQIDGLSLDEWRVAALSFHGSTFGRPAAMVTFAINHALAGDLVVWQIRLTNVVLHILCGGLVFMLARLLGRGMWGPDERRADVFALLATALWLLHPLHVSTVLYSIQRMTQLATLFSLTGLVIFTHRRLRWRDRAPPPGEVVGVALKLFLCTVLATLSKENGILLPWLVVVVEVAFFRGRWGGRDVGWLRALSWGALLLPALGLVLLAQPALLQHLGDYSRRDFTLSDRLFTQARVLWHYVHWLALPDIQAMGLHHDDIPVSRGLLQPWTTVVAIAAWGVLLGGAFALRRRLPFLLFAVLFFLAGHALESSVLPLEMAWEHRNYLPSVALLMLLAAGMLALCRRLAPRRQVAVILMVPVILGPLLWLRADRWSDELTLGFHNVVNHPDSVRANYEYASALFDAWQADRESELARKRLIASRHYYERMYQLAPDRVETLISLYVLDAYYFKALGEKADWFARVEQLAAQRPLSASGINALSMLGQCLREQYCDLERSRVEAFFAQLVKHNSHKQQVWMAWVEYLREVAGEPDIAERVLRRALTRNDGDAELWLQLANHLARYGDTGGALQAIAESMRRDEGRRYLNNFRAGFAGDS